MLAGRLGGREAEAELSERRLDERRLDERQEASGEGGASVLEQSEGARFCGGQLTDRRSASPLDCTRPVRDKLAQTKGTLARCAQHLRWAASKGCAELDEPSGGLGGSH